MAKFPEPPPPGGLARIGPQLQPLPAAQELWRIYFRGGRFPTLWRDFRYYGPTGSRFDHHPPPSRLHADRAILYAASSALTALAEVFQQARVIDRVRGEPWLVAFRTVRIVQLLDLGPGSAWPTRAGASANINSGPRPRARRWSARIHGDYPGVEGLHYCSSMNGNLPAVALYGRAIDALPAAPSYHRALADPLLFTVMQNAAHDLGYRLR